MATKQVSVWHRIRRDTATGGSLLLDFGHGYQNPEEKAVSGTLDDFFTMFGYEGCHLASVTIIDGQEVFFFEERITVEAPSGNV